MVDNLVYIDDYIDNSTTATAKAAIDLIDNIDNLDASDRFIKLKAMVDLLTETAQRSSEKAALAKVTSDAVDRHCNRLDANLVKFEENYPIGKLRIASLPGLAPSSKTLREYSKLSSKEKITKKINDRKESQSAKKRRAAKEDMMSIPRSLKDARTHSDKGKPMKALPSRKNGKLKSSETDVSVDPNEPVYCYCQGVSYGEMVACDNAECDIEWFHLACVDLKTVPKGKWYCDNCNKYKGKQRRS
ncbi:hypothetical protein INT48_001900 [Thamnidium elegans]|uniref:PHD-type domain-containing protein n=1 Tax=Thamnidium elegans TaxID=101142 RepID=A0A8H7SFS6_9FUNG|nr:hypothetical protein INT48_001900 [Thamnidium elegans]